MQYDTSHIPVVKKWLKLNDSVCWDLNTLLTGEYLLHLVASDGKWFLSLAQWESEMMAVFIPDFHHYGPM